MVINMQAGMAYNPRDATPYHGYYAKPPTSRERIPYLPSQENLFLDPKADILALMRMTQADIMELLKSLFPGPHGGRRMHVVPCAVRSIRFRA